MSRPRDQLETVRRVVVVFDICSSTSIFQDLLDSENHRRWRNLLIRLKKFLNRERKSLPFEIYKFLGDGWILMFRKDVPGAELMHLLERLNARYESLFKKFIRKVLSTGGHSVGLTFGIDIGRIVKFKMFGRPEYLGRALNVASRLQAAIRQKDKQPQGKVLISKSAHVHLKLPKSKRYAGKLVERKLRNIGSKNYEARKIILA